MERSLLLGLLKVVMQEHPKSDPRIPKEYWDLRDLFSEKDSDALLLITPLTVELKSFLRLNSKNLNSTQSLHES